MHPAHGFYADFPVVQAQHRDMFPTTKQGAALAAAGRKTTIMSLLDLTHSGSGLAGRLADAFARLAEGRRRRSLYRRTVRELGALDDRGLRDLGLNRDMIEDVARNGMAATRS